MYSSSSASRQKWNRVAQGQRVPLEALGALGLAPTPRCCKIFRATTTTTKQSPNNHNTQINHNNHQTITTNNHNTQMNHNNHNSHKLWAFLFRTFYKRPLWRRRLFHYVKASLVAWLIDEEMSLKPWSSSGRKFVGALCWLGIGTF